MKKVLSALVLSAAVVATAGQAQAEVFGNYGDFKSFNGTMVSVIYTDSTEIIINNGNFLTTNNTASFDHTFAEVDKNLSTVDYKSILLGLGDTGSVRVAFYLDDMYSFATNPQYWEIYYASTDPAASINTPSGNRFQWNNFDVRSTNLLNNSNTTSQGADFYVVSSLPGASNGYGIGQTSYYKGQMNNIYGVGSYGGINEAVGRPFAELDLSLVENANKLEFDMGLMKVQYNTNRTTGFTDDVKTSFGSVATLRFDKRDGSLTLNATGEAEVAPVPVPAAAWLLGSGILGLVGLRRRK